MAGANLVFENAPRDVDQLMSFGRYSLRNLAYEIGLITKEDPAGVTAFDKLALRDRAQEVYNALLQLDKKQKADGGEEKKTRAPKGNSKRQPVKPKEEAAPATKAAKAATTTTPSGGALVADLEPVLNELATLRKMVIALSQEVGELSGMLSETLQVSKANMYMNGLVGEHVMQGDINEMIAEGFTGGDGIEVPEPTEGNG